MLLGGIVTDFREGMTKTGKPYGVVKIEDFTGSGEIALFGNNYIEYSKYCKPGMYLLITARVEPRRWNENELDFNIGSIRLLQDEKDKLIEKSVSLCRSTISTSLQSMNYLCSSKTIRDKACYISKW
mgnify:FL=1